MPIYINIQGKSQTESEQIFSNRTVSSIQEILPVSPVKSPLIGKRTLILCAILILVSIIIGVFLRSQQKALDDIYRPAVKSSPATPSQTLTSPTQGVSNEKSETIKWTDTTNSFSVEFPMDWFKTTIPTPGMPKGQELQGRARCDRLNVRDCIDEIISSKIIDNPKHLSLNDTAINELSRTEVNPEFIRHNTFSDGTPFILVENISATDAIRQIYLIKSSESTIKIQFTGGKEDLSQFISTFKLIKTPRKIKYEDGAKLSQDVVDVMRKYYPDTDSYPKFNNFVRYGNYYIEVSVQSKYPSGFAVGLIKRPKGWIKVWAGQDRPPCKTLELHLAPMRIECARLGTEGFDETHAPIDTADIEEFIKKGFGLSNGDVIISQVVEGDTAYGSLTTKEGYGSYWAVGKIEGKWSYGFGGNGIPTCTDVEEFPIGVFGGKFDSCYSDASQLINRKTNTLIQ